jgi:hypothetical protein
MLTGTVLLLLVCHVLVLHAVRELVFRRRQRLVALYRPLVASALHDDDSAPSLALLRSTPRRHLSVLSALVVEPLRALKGTITDRARATAEALGLVGKWEADLYHKRWWIRAEAAHSLGLVRHGSAVRPLIAALDDPHEEVRAAAVEALGLIGNPSAIPELVARLGEQSRHQRVRIVEALQQFGLSAVTPLLDHAQRCPEDLAIVADLLGSLEAPAAVESLLSWSGHPRADVRASVMRAIGAIGVDERVYYHVLRALTDEAGDVRAAAAWALGRSGRQEAASYLAPRLQDEWIVAAQSARALRHLGEPGRRELEAAAALDQGELARQMLWESGAEMPA